MVLVQKLSIPYGHCHRITVMSHTGCVSSNTDILDPGERTSTGVRTERVRKLLTSGSRCQKFLKRNNCSQEADTIFVRPTKS